MKSLSAIAVALLFTALTAFGAFACPRIGGLIDYNCDQLSKLGFTGDSIVFGIGDLRNGNQGGYVLRIADDYPESEVNNIGVPGVTTYRLFSGFKRNLLKPQNGTTKRKTKFSDFLMIAVGVNDYWETGSAPLAVRNLKRLVKFLRSNLSEDLGVPPVIVVATLAPTLRGFQQPFVAEFNRLLLKQNSKEFPVRIRFDLMDPHLISQDGLHPTSAGYHAMEQIVQQFIGDGLRTLWKQNRVDNDHDGVYDYFERNRFLTDPQLDDTDGDTLLDGQELFTHMTDPLVVDTDGDGAADNIEITGGTDPLDPLSF